MTERNSLELDDGSELTWDDSDEARDIAFDKLFYLFKYSGMFTHEDFLNTTSCFISTATDVLEEIATQCFEFEVTEKENVIEVKELLFKETSTDENFKCYEAETVFGKYIIFVEDYLLNKKNFRVVSPMSLKKGVGYTELVGNYSSLADAYHFAQKHFKNFVSLAASK